MISQRLRSMSEDGEVIEGLAPKLQSAFKTIANIDIAGETEGSLRSTYDILSDLAKVWDTLRDDQRQYLGELAAGRLDNQDCPNVQKCAWETALTA